MFEQRTDGGTLLTHSTIKLALLDLDQFAYTERTGAIMPRGTRNFVVAWKSVLTKFNMDLNSIDRKKLFSMMEKDLDSYETKKAETAAAAYPVIDAGELKSGTKNLHATFTNHAKSNELEIGALAMAFTMDHGGEFDANKSLLRSIINHPSNVAAFSISLGGAPKVIRLLDIKGKATGLKPFDKTRKPRKSKKSAEGEENPF